MIDGEGKLEELLTADELRDDDLLLEFVNLREGDAVVEGDDDDDVTEGILEFFVRLLAGRYVDDVLILEEFLLFFTDPLGRNEEDDEGSVRNARGMTKLS
jgi:hypothetical protein